MPELRVIDLMRNFGHMPALARGAAIIVMDGGLQDPPELIPRFVEEWRGGRRLQPADCKVPRRKRRVRSMRDHALIFDDCYKK